MKRAQIAHFLFCSNHALQASGIKIQSVINYIYIYINRMRAQKHLDLVSYIMLMLQSKEQCYCINFMRNKQKWRQKWTVRSLKRNENKDNFSFHSLKMLCICIP